MLTKDDYEKRIVAYKAVFTSVARILGDDHQMVKLMGSLAWGRSDADRGPDQDTIRAIATEYGFLYGCERMLVKWCNLVGDKKALRLLLDTVRERVHAC